MNILDTYIKATNSHDFKEIEKILHPDAVYFFTDKTCKTVREIQDYFENAWNTVKDENYEAHDVNWIFKSEQSITCTYTYFYEGYVNNKYASGRGRATNVFVKKSNRWLLIHEHLSPLPS
ncbi:YybH family protein [Piscibacillus sp. B03]|uniref:YybH family protein n=1 Tax=Piscibacillus sp. B03 TaxID=3457430 RepID=UPI003FCCE8BF